MLMDCHCHSVHGSHDARITYKQIAERSKERGVRAVVMAEHEEFSDAAVLRDVSDKYEVLFIPGIEWALPQWGHFVGINISTLSNPQVRRDELAEHFSELAKEIAALPEIARPDQVANMPSLQWLRERLSGIPKEPLKLFKAVRAAGGLTFWAHPFQFGSRLRHAYDLFALQELKGPDNSSSRMRQNHSIADFVSFMVKEHSDVIEVLNHVDAVECMNGSEPDRGLNSLLARALTGLLGKAKTAGSDAHEYPDIATAAIALPEGQHSAGELVSLIQQGTGEAVFLGGQPAELRP